MNFDSYKKSLGPRLQYTQSHKNIDSVIDSLDKILLGNYSNQLLLPLDDFITHWFNFLSNQQIMMFSNSKDGKSFYFYFSIAERDLLVGHLASTFSKISDESLKEQVKVITDYLNVIKDLPTVDFE